MTCRRCRRAFPSKRRTSGDTAADSRQILSSAADLAWWFGWSVQDVYALPLDEFEDWHKEAARQIKAGYGRSV